MKDNPLNREEDIGEESKFENGVAPGRSPETCPYRVVNGANVEAKCELLNEIFRLDLAADANVLPDVCNSCCSESEPSVEQFNPTIASLVYGIAEALGHSANQLRGQALENLKSPDDWVTAAETPPAGPDELIRFVRPARRTVGKGMHRSGWPFARSWLETIDPGQSILFDEFVEQTFCYETPGEPHTEPWIGIIHYPPAVPDFAGRRNQLQYLFRRPEWRESARWLRGVIVLSNYLADFLRNELQVPVEVVRHPIGRAELEWSLSAFQSGDRQLVQLGSFLRNTRAIFQVPRIDGYQKTRVLLRMEWLTAYDNAVAEYWNHRGDRAEYGGVRDLGYVSLRRYDQILSRSVILTELFDASANNVVLECIASSTPLIVNRHPATIEYLGADYPLFFDDIEEVPDLLSDDRLVDAHEYLKTMDRRFLDGEYFARSCEDAIRRILSRDSGNLPRDVVERNPLQDTPRTTVTPAANLLERAVTVPTVTASEAEPSDCVHRSERLLRIERDVFEPHDALNVYNCELHGPCAPAFESLPAKVDARNCLFCRDYSQSKLIRIALLTPFWKVGGSERWFLSLLRNLRGVQCTGIVLPDGAPSDERVVAEALRYCRVVGTRVISKENNSSRVERFADLHEAVESVTSNSDVVLAWGLDNLSAVQPLLNGKPVVLISHGTDEWTERFLAASVPYADHLVAVSKAAQAAFPAELRERATVIWNGVEIDRLVPTRDSNEIRKSWNVDEQDVLIGFVGRFDANKRPVLVAQAAAAVGGVAVFRTAGQRDALMEEQIRDITQGHCRFVGDDPIGNFYHAVDCVMLPSVNEGMSLVGLESWMTGTPLVATQVGGIPELEQAFGPLTVRLSDDPEPDELASQIRHALSDEFRPTVERARQVAWERLTAARMAREWEEFLTQVASGNSASSI